jgi:ADP-heptose:LPS heptosyltransferase
MKQPARPLDDPIDLGSLERIAVVKLDHIGDLLLATPVFEALRRFCPKARIAAVVGSWSESVLKNNPFVDEVVAYDAPWLDRDERSLDPIVRGNNRAAVARLGAAGYDLVVNLRSDQLNVYFASLMGSRYLLSHDNESAFAGLITHGGECPPGLHALAQHVQLLSRIGVEVKGRPRLFPADDDRVWAERTVPAGPVWIALFPGAGFRLKQWPEDRFVELARRLRKMGLALLVVGGKAEAAVAARLERACGALNLCGKTTLQQLACVLNRASLLVSNDSAPVHVAASEGTSVVVITRPVVRDEFAPVGEGHVVLSAPTCAEPCMGWDSRVQPDPAARCHCIESITVEQVELAVYERLLGLHAAGSLPHRQVRETATRSCD